MFKDVNEDELAYNSADYWCDLCGDGIKCTSKNINGKLLEICNNCDKFF